MVHKGASEDVLALPVHDAVILAEVGHRDWAVEAMSDLNVGLGSGIAMRRLRLNGIELVAERNERKSAQTHFVCRDDVHIFIERHCHWGSAASGVEGICTGVKFPAQFNFFVA